MLKRRSHSVDPDSPSRRKSLNEEVRARSSFEVTALGLDTHLLLHPQIQHPLQEPPVQPAQAVVVDAAR